MFDYIMRHSGLEFHFFAGMQSILKKAGRHMINIADKLIVEGIEKSKMEVSFDLLKSGIFVDAVSRSTDLPSQEIEKLKDF